MPPSPDVMAAALSLVQAAIRTLPSYPRIIEERPGWERDRIELYLSPRACRIIDALELPPVEESK